MPVNFIMNSLFIVGEAVRRLMTLAGNNLETVLRCFQRIIDDPVYRRQVWLAMTGKLVIGEITQDEWIERESNTMDQLGLLTDENQHQIEQLAKADKFGVNQYFVPAGLTRERLIELARKVGLKIHSEPYCNGQELLTEAGVLDCNLSAIMNSTDAEHRPFNLNFDEHETWTKEQGGEGLTSAEETLYLIIRHFMAFGHILFMGGWIRCRNTRGAGWSLDVDFSADVGLNVGWADRSDRDWRFGAVARKFMSRLVS